MGEGGLIAKLLRGGAALLGAAAITLAIFLVLPLMQTLGTPPDENLEVREMSAVLEPPPPPPIEQEEPPEPPEPEEPPKLDESAQPLDLSQLELALNPGMGGADAAAFALDLSGVLDAAGGDGGLDEVFSLSELDQRPRPVFQRPPRYPSDAAQKRLAGTVYVTFLVDRQGRVVNPKVDGSTAGVFEDAALEAVRSWRFEPGTRRGEPVQFKMRIPITFNPPS